jgi:hypothetical protein
MEDVGIFYAHLGYFVAIWYILRPFGIFFRFWHLSPRKIWQPWFSAITYFQPIFKERFFSLF